MESTCAFNDSNLIAFIEHMLTHKPQPIHESATTASNSLSLHIETILRLCSGSLFPPDIRWRGRYPTLPVCPEWYKSGS